MKKRCPIFTLLCISLLIGGCSLKETKAPNSTDNIQTSDGNDTSFAKSEKVMTGKIIEISDDMILVADIEEKNGLYQISLDKGMGDISEIRPGDLVEIGFDGLVLEIYPAIIANPDYIRFLEKSEDFVGLYHDIFKDLFDADSGLNYGIDFMAFDFSKDKILTDSEKNALLYLLWNTTQVETRLSNYKDLLSEKLITVDEPTGFTQLETGLLFTMETSILEKDTFQFTAEKWKSSLGAYVFYDCTAKKENGIWGYDIGAEMIS